MKAKVTLHSIPNFCFLFFLDQSNTLPDKVAMDDAPAEDRAEKENDIAKIK